MHIKNLTLKNFRNYADENFTFTDGLNVLYGRNAQGKTNCAEAVFYLCTGVSPRARRDRQLIRQGQTRAEISAVACGRYGDVNISAAIFENGREIRVNGNKITKNADLLGNIFSVFFSPSELRLIQDGPDERRRFLNISISQLSRPYYTALLRYNKILEQRNNLLKDRDTGLIYDTLPVWDEQLAKYAAIVVRHRTDFVTRLAPIAKEEHLRLTDGAEELEMYTKLCMSPMEAIKTATSMAAQALRQPDIGVLAAGKTADVLVVKGDVLANIALLQNKADLTIIHNGKLVTGTL